MSRTGRTALTRHPERGSHDRAVVDAILDEALVCHVGFLSSGQPLVIPTTHVRIGDHLVLHGSALSRTIGELGRGVACCVTVTLVDGLVLSRSAFGHSVNYRSAVVLGTAEPIVEPAEVAASLQALVEHVVPGRWAEVRGPSAKELALTGLVRINLDEVSAKVRTGPPVDPAADRRTATWAGVLPVAQVVGLPSGDSALDPAVPVAPSAAARVGPLRRWT
ncbi:MAG: pyridoxamine 5'-phosphate oxidase family protein [Candidatus Dormibacteria bacterium]